MIPVDQTRFHDPEGKSPPGNCWAACLASILEFRLEDVPDLADYWTPDASAAKVWNAYYDATIAWLAKQNLGFVEAHFDQYNRDLTDNAWCLIAGPSPRYPVFHSVVGRNFEVVHDPHPSRAGLAGERREWLFGYVVLLDPARR